MKISVKAKPNSREEKVEKVDLPLPEGFGGAGDYYVVSVKEPPVQGRANEAIVRVLAEYFGVSKFKVKIVSGWTSRQKVVEIYE